MTWVAVAVAGAAVVGGVVQNNSATKSSNAIKNSTNASNAELARQYDQTRADQAPYRNIGGQALNTLGRYYGYSTDAPLSYEDWSKQQPQQDALAASHPVTHKSKHHGLFGGGLVGSILAPNPKDFVSRNLDPAGGVYSLIKDGTGSKTTPGTPYDPKAAYQSYVTDYQGKHPQPTGPDPSVFTNSPDYQFRRDEGLRGIEHTAAAGGGAFSGNALRALNEFNSNLASSEFGGWFNRQASLAGIGQTATNTTDAFGANTSGQIAQNNQYAGAARASGIQQQGQGYQNLLGDLAGAYGYYSANRRPVT